LGAIFEIGPSALLTKH